MSGYKMNEAEAVKRLEQIGEYLEVDIGSEEFRDAVKELKIPMRKEHFTYDPEKKVFDLVLFDPIEMRDESGDAISKISIRRTTMDEKKAAQGYKKTESFSQATHMIAIATDLELGFAGRLQDKDIARINAVLMVFFG